VAKRTLNLTIDEAAVERARRFGERHHTSISRLVGDFLASLPVDGDDRLADLPPITRRLYGCAAGGPDEVDYHRHLEDKYGR
jgi:hypothetical protein